MKSTNIKKKKIKNIVSEKEEEILERKNLEISGNRPFIKNKVKEKEEEIGKEKFGILEKKKYEITDRFSE